MKKFFIIYVRGAVLVTLAALLITFSSLKNNPAVCEAMTRGFSRFYGAVMSKITSWVPFSLTELSFITLGAGIIALFTFAMIGLKRKKYIGSINRGLEIGCIILLSLNSYTLSCEFAYKRKEMPLPYYEGEILRTEHIPIYNYYVDDVNLCISELEFEETGEVKTNMSLQELTDEIKKAYAIIDGDDYFASHFGGVKPMLSSFIYREFQITGVTYSPLAEANINILNTKTGIPLTVAHELAHTKGVMREDDANKLAFYVCINSDHPYLRYSAYTAYFSQLSGMVTDYYLKEEEMENLHKLDATFRKTRYYEYQYWKEHDLLGDIGEFINDLYIKSNGVETGVDSYYEGTDYKEDPETHQLIPSYYQKLLLEKYYRK